jgi:short subunit dehydrogenase-like uncharacterized protein
MRGMIVLYGATGYTGRLVTRELVERGADFVLGGRSREKLDRASPEAGAGAPTRVASVDDPASLRALLDGADVLINCAGPFTHAGEPVVRAAVDAGVHYVDSTGEQPFIRMVFERYGPPAERKGIALVPACGFDYVPGDCIARIAARGREPLEELVLAYHLEGFGMTRGTMRSALEMMKGGSAVEYRDGDWRAAPNGVVRASFDFGGSIGRVPVGPYPAGEPITVPRHTDVRNVVVKLSARAAMPQPMVPFAAYLIPLFNRVLKTPIAPLLNRAIDRLPEGPPEDARRAVTWKIVAQGHTRDGRDSVRASVSGRDVYGLTARALVWAAEEIQADRHSGPGALGPAAAFDPEEMLGALTDFGVEWHSDAQASPVL